MSATKPKQNNKRRQRANWDDYERRKQSWVFENPRATPRQYERAMARISKELRL